MHLQMALYESILASPYRTLNGEEADFFFVPVLDSCIITRADDAPHLSMEVYFLDLGYGYVMDACDSIFYAHVFIKKGNERIFFYFPVYILFLC